MAQFSFLASTAQIFPEPDTLVFGNGCTAYLKINIQMRSCAPPLHPHACLLCNDFDEHAFRYPVSTLHAIQDSQFFKASIRHIKATQGLFQGSILPYGFDTHTL